MARVHGNLQLTGTLGEITFYRRNGKWFARQKSGLTKERVKSDPKFKRSLENMAEFGITATITREIWEHFPKAWKVFRDPQAFVRFKARAYEIIKQGPGLRGKKDWLPAIIPHNWSGFQFNLKNYFASSCRQDLPTTWNPASSTLTLSLSPIVEELYTNPPPGKAAPMQSLNLRDSYSGPISTILSAIPGSPLPNGRIISSNTPNTNFPSWPEPRFRLRFRFHFRHYPVSPLGTAFRPSSESHSSRKLAEEDIPSKKKHP